jgi:hypothetical protein
VSFAALTPGIWVQIPLEARVSVCVCVVLYVGSGFARADLPSKESYRLCMKLRK